MGRQEQFVYDSTGNIIQFDEITLSYGAGDRLQRRGTCQYEYDGNGRLIRKIEPGTPEPKVWLFGWDAEDQLRSVTTPSGEIWQYQYDALGRRIVKQGPEHNVRFVWDGDVVAHEVEQDTVQSYWVFDPDSFAPLAKVEQGQLYAVICDHLGTPKELLDNQGRVVWAVSQRAWGEVEQVRVEEVACPIRFQGQWADAETGLYYNRFRFYEPGSGRFVSSDPIGLLGGKRLYQYVPNPIGWVDPFGLCEDSPSSYLKTALEKQGLEKAPIKFKHKWSANGYDYEVRIHPAEPAHGKTGSIYRVARHQQGTNAQGQGFGWEYMDNSGNWHHTSTLKPGKPGQPNPLYNDTAARDTHMEIPNEFL